MADAQSIHHLDRDLAALDGNPEAGALSRIDLLNDLAWSLSDTDLHRAYELGAAAYALASSPPAAPYAAGMAYGLRTQGYINQRLGDYALGLTQLLQAQDLFESLDLWDGLADVFDGQAGIYAQTGQYPEALDLTHRQLAAAQRAGDRRRIANAYNNLAAIYGDTRDHARAIATLRQNLQLAADIGYPRIEFLSSANLAEMQLETGDYAEALASAGRALRVCREASFELFEAHALELVGRSYQKLGDYPQAIALLEQALASATKLDARVTAAQVLLDIGEAYRDMQQLDHALDFVQRSVEVAQAVDSRSVLVEAHLLLSGLYEQQGDLAPALAHFKQHNALKEAVFGERAYQRLKVLQVVHDTATARHEAEILQLKTQQLEREIDEQRQVEGFLQAARDSLEEQVQARTSELSDTITLLHQEIAERERAEAEIQQLVETLEQRVAARTDELATFFDLTLLAGQVANLDDVFDQVLPRITEATRSRVICIHLLDADRTALRLVAQENIPAEAQAQLQTVELSPEFQRWLHQANDPLVTTALSHMATVPAVFHLPGFQTFLGAQIRMGQRAEGMLSCFRFTSRGFGVDEVALVMALAEQIGMMLENHRLRQNAEAMAVLEERQRLARDLHDSVSQSLYSLSLFSRAGREAAEDGDMDRLNHSLAELERNTLHTLREMRLLLYELRPADLEREGLVQAVQLRLNTVERRAGLQLDVQLDELPGLSRSGEVDLYHIIVEALNNVVKHAAATHLTLQLTHAGGCLHLHIADDGQGFDLVQAKGGMGLVNIRERVARLDGRLSISSEPGRGTWLEAVIPYRTEAS